jgi:hypothetical protein
MKDWIQDHYPENDMTYNKLRWVVKKAWEVVPQERLRELILRIPERCQTVIDANSKYIPY